MRSEEKPIVLTISVFYLIPYEGKGDSNIIFNIEGALIQTKTLLESIEEEKEAHI